MKSYHGSRSIKQGTLRTLIITANTNEFARVAGTDDDRLGDLTDWSVIRGAQYCRLASQIPNPLDLYLNGQWQNRHD